MKLYFVPKTECVQTWPAASMLLGSGGITGHEIIGSGDGDGTSGEDDDL